MSDYSVYLSNGTFLVDLVPLRVDSTTTSLNLQGDSIVPRLGQINPTNLVHLTENFANTTPPARPLIGQLWYNSTLATLSVWSATAWVGVGGGSAIGPTGATGPTGAAGGPTVQPGAP